MKPSIWGPSAWLYLHLLSFSYPDNPTKQDISNHKIFLESFGKTLPCIKCKNNYKNHIKNFDIDNALTSKVNFINFIWKLHNKVNKALDKNTLLFNDFINSYQRLLEINNLNIFELIKTLEKYRKIIIFLLISIIFTVLFIIYYRLKILN